MTWEEFYDKFYEWADSTQVNRISQLTTFGSHEEVAEIAQMYSDEKAASRLIIKALNSGVRFVAEEIVDLQMYVSKECMNQLVVKSGCPFTREQIEELAFSIDDDIYADLEKKYCQYEEYEDSTDLSESEITAFPKQKKPGKLFSLLAFGGMLAEGPNKTVNQRFRVGDHVRVKYRGQEGTVVDINGSLYMVSMKDGGYVDSYYENQLEKAW